MRTPLAIVVEVDLLVTQQDWSSKWIRTFESRVTEETDIKQTVALGMYNEFLSKRMVSLVTLIVMSPIPYALMTDPPIPLT